MTIRMKYIARAVKRAIVNNQYKIYKIILPAVVGLFPFSSRAENYFNPAFLSGDASAVADLSRFEDSNGQAPGKYRVDIYLNNQFVATEDVNFRVDKNSKDETGLAPCFSLARMEAMGLNPKAYPDLAKLAPEQCVPFEAIPESSTNFDFENQKLNISIPQAGLQQSARGYIPPEQWDQGINALMVSYDFSGSNSGGETHEDNYYLNLQSGLNLGAWRLRDYSTWNYTSGEGDVQNEWEHISTYVERTVEPLKGELTVGESYTPSDVFDSLSFRGVQLASDDNMLPDSLKGFAPTVRGIAKSNARVTIKQNGYVIYQTYVSPGAFAISDLYPTSSSGDLQVTVKETNGSENTYTVPYSAVPLLQREGRLKYAVTAGRYRSSNDQQDDVGFGQGTLIWGLTHGITAYGGTQVSSNYRAFAAGLGLNMGDIGAISVDITQANSTLVDGSQHEGQSVRFLYAKALNDLGTNFQLLGYRYSTQGFYTLDETTYKHMDGYNGDDEWKDDNHDGKQDEPDWTDFYNLYYTKKGKIQINVSQTLGDNGSLFVTGSEQSYWHTDETDKLLQIGYNGNWGGISYSLTWNYDRSPGETEADEVYAFNVSLPIGQWLAGQGNGDIYHAANSMNASYSMNTDRHGKTSQTAGLNGTALDGNNLSYDVQESDGNHGVGNSGSASLNYQGTYGNLKAGYNYSEGYHQTNYGMSGGAVLHRNGLTLSQPLGDTNILVKAPGAAGVELENTTGVKTDWRGYAVIPYATTYRQNRVALNTNTMGANVDIDDAVTNVVPTQGAMVRAEFNSHVGSRALITLLHDGKPVPFGSTVTELNSNTASLVGDDGQVYLSGLSDSGKLAVQWGSGAAKKCTAMYHISKPDNTGIVRLTQICQ
ncbi:outer membrane usher protein FimD [Salmonella enterica subsp. salamae]|nr:outer membrane usher protein FimD [Salmonella enterica subsp. salamae]ECJ2280733.1 outer membrane usher protein FimD [Salmonella enterica subsp. salamae]